MGQLRDGFIPIPRTGPPARLPLKVTAVSPPGRAGPCATRAGWGPGAGSGARARERHRELSRAWQRARRVLCQAQSLTLAGTEVSASSPSSTLLMGNARPRTGHPSPGVAAGRGAGPGPPGGVGAAAGPPGPGQGHREPGPRSCHNRAGQELEARTRARQHPQGPTQPQPSSQGCGELSREGGGRRGGRETHSPCEKDALNVLHPLGCTLDTAAS